MDVTIAEHVDLDAIRQKAALAARKAMSRHISNAAARLAVTIVVDYCS
jgi:DNA-binding FadR family transcriptional regulator